MQQNRRSSPVRASIVLLAIFSMAAALLAPGSRSFAQDYPNRPIRIVVPTQPGAAQDIIARLLQPYLEK